MIPPRAAALPDPTTRALLAVARHHRLLAAAVDHLRRSAARLFGGGFRRDRVVTAARNMMLGQARRSASARSAAAGIPTIVLKGLDYETRLYGAPGARPTADVDLLVPERKATRGVRRARSPWIRAARRRARIRRSRLSRGRLDPRRRRGGPPHGAGAAGSLPDRLPGGLAGRRDLPARRHRRSGLARPHAASSRPCTWRSITSQVPAIYLLDLARLWGHGIDAAQLDAAGRRLAVPAPLAHRVGHGRYVPAWAGHGTDFRR